MANTITSLIPDVYAALDVVSRELVGIIPAVMRDPSVERAAVGQNVRSFVAPVTTSSAITPGVTAPDTGDQTIGNVNITITDAEAAFFRWRGEESRGLNNGGPGVLSIQQQQIAQALRTLTNKIELKVCTVAALGASRAYGTANTTPFASTLTDINNMRKILDDNGAPASDRHYIMNTTAGLAMRNLTQLTNVNQAGSSDMLRQGELTAQPLSGFSLRESAQIVSPASGAGTGYLSNLIAGYAVGATAIAVDVGSGTVLAGDVVTFAGDTHKYVVASATAGSSVTLVTLAAPGLQQTLADDVAMTIVAASHRNLAFSRNAIILAARLPALPDGGDMASDRTTIVDPRSGLAFELAMYPQYKQMLYEVSIAWGATVVKAEHLCINLGEA